jgi:hypothetical protein
MNEIEKTHYKTKDPGQDFHRDHGIPIRRGEIVFRKVIYSEYVVKGDSQGSSFIARFKLKNVRPDRRLDLALY